MNNLQNRTLAKILVATPTIVALFHVAVAIFMQQPVASLGPYHERQAHAVGGFVGGVWEAWTTFVENVWNDMLVRYIVSLCWIFLISMVYMGPCIALLLWEREYCLPTPTTKNPRPLLKNPWNVVCLSLLYLTIICRHQFLTILVSVAVLFVGTIFICVLGAYTILNMIELFQIYHGSGNHVDSGLMLTSVYLAFQLLVVCCPHHQSPNTDTDTYKDSIAAAHDLVSLLSSQVFLRELIMKVSQSIVEAAALLCIFSVGCASGKRFLLETLTGETNSDENQYCPEQASDATFGSNTDVDISWERPAEAVLLSEKSESSSCPHDKNLVDVE